MSKPRALALLAALIAAEPRIALAMPPQPATEPEQVDRARETAALGRAEELYLEGSALYTAADYPGAIAAFTEALKIVTREGGLSPAVRGALVFNLAQAHVRAHGIDKQGSHLLVARDLYRRLLEEADELGHDEPEKQRTRDLLAEVERMIAKEDVKPEKPVATTEPAVTGPQAATTRPPAQKPRDRSKVQRRAGIGLLAAGSVVATAGIGLIGWGATFKPAAEDDIINPETPSPNEQQRLDDAIREGKIVMGSGAAVLVAGAGLIAGGVVLFLRSRKARSASNPPATAMPVFGPSFAGIAAQARF